MKVGFVLPIVTGDVGARLPRYAEVREMALLAEDAGFDSLWVPDHLRWAGSWECWSVLAGLAEATSRIELGPWVSCVHFHNPAVLAKKAATIDELSGGRLILGLGAGWHQPEFDAFGLPFDHRVDRFEEALQIIIPLLREGRVTFRGKYHQAIDCEIVPRGPRPDGPPILIGAAGPRMLRLAARYADMWDYGPRLMSSTRAELLAGLDTACEEVGRDVESIKVQDGLLAIYPDLGPVEEESKNMATPVGGVAADLRKLEMLGVDHAVCLVQPPTSAALGRLADEVHAYREATAR